ncbi:MAG: cell division protein SepF [Candidatus Aenigmatarchaeota archaeon]
MKFPFFGKKKEVEGTVEEYTELPLEGEELEKLKIIIDKVDDYMSIDRIIRNVREGNIVIARIKQLKEENAEELKHAISKIKTATVNFDGDIAGAGDEWLIVTPRNVRIAR